MSNLEIYLKNFHYPFRSMKREKGVREIIIYDPSFDHKQYSIYVYDKDYTLNGKTYRYILWDYTKNTQRIGETEFDILKEMGVLE